jgi:hypothetical protein
MKRARDSRPDGAWLADALRARAQDHEADLERIRAGFERLTTEGATPGTRRRRPLGPARVRLLGIPLGIAAVLASATVAVAVSVGIAVSSIPHSTVPIASPETSSAATVTTSETPSAPTASAKATSPAEGAIASATTQGTAAATGATGALAAAGSVDPHSTEFWAQENLALTTARPVRDLRITVTVSGGSGVVSTGFWTTLPSAELESSVTRVSGGLEYEIILKPGLSLGPTTYRFGFQFNRPASGHDFALDTYHVSATAGDATALTASGAFAG